MTHRILAVALAAALTACPLVREGALRVTPGVSDPVDCTPGVWRCAGSVPVLCSPTPVPGSNRHREWSQLPVRPDGTPRMCEGGCVVDADGGVAHCAAADGGAL